MSLSPFTGTLLKMEFPQVLHFLTDELPLLLEVRAWTLMVLIVIMIMMVVVVVLILIMMVVVVIVVIVVVMIGMAVVHTHTRAHTHTLTHATSLYYLKLTSPSRLSSAVAFPWT